MEITKAAIAGTVESSDISIAIEPNDGSGIEILLESPVEKQFGKQIKKVIEDTLKENGVKNASIKAMDKGAIDYVIKARTQTAIYRASEDQEYSWGSEK